MEKMVVLSYVDDCFYWYTYELLGKWFLDTLGKIFHVNFLGYAHWFMSIIISQMKDHSISIDQDRYATSVVGKYLYTATVKAGTKFYNTTLPSDMIFTKVDAYTSYNGPVGSNHGSLGPVPAPVARGCHGPQNCY